MLSFSFQRQQGAGILSFSGEISSHHNDDFRSALMLSINNADKVVVNFDEVSAFDRICLQTLYSAVKMAKRLKKDLIINMAAIRERARYNGVTCSIMGCTMCGKRDCLSSQSVAMEAAS